MSLKYIDTFDTEYNGEELKVTLHYTDYEKQRIEFDYKGHSVYMFYKNKYDWYNMTGMVCRIIDNLGIKGFEKYRELEQEISLIKLNNIIIGDKVYKPYEYSISSGYLKYYSMLIEMEDGQRLDGRPLYNFESFRIEDKDEYNKTKTFENLVYRVSNYYKNKNILPSDIHLEEDKTRKYQEIQLWFTEKEIKSIHV